MGWKSTYLLKNYIFGEKEKNQWTLFSELGTVSLPLFRQSLHIPTSYASHDMDCTFLSKFVYFLISSPFPLPLPSSGRERARPAHVLLLLRQAALGRAVARRRDRQAQGRGGEGETLHMQGTRIGFLHKLSED